MAAGRALGGQAARRRRKRSRQRRQGDDPPGRPLRPRRLRPPGRGRARATHGRVDVLVNNAGRSIRRSIANSYDRFHDFERTMQLNYFGALKLILGFLPGMRERKVRPHHQHLVDRRADQHAALLGLRRQQERARRLLALHRLRGRRRQGQHHDRLHAAGAHADDRADRHVRRVPDDQPGRGGRPDHAER